MPPGKSVRSIREAPAMATAPDSVLRPDEVARLAPAQGIARGLPRSAFTDEAFFRLECERLFPRQWIFVGHAHDIPAPGDVMPVTVAGVPVILVRARNGEVNAFHNTCRHRGRKLVDEVCRNRQLLVCPYHRWAYGLDGSLRATPHFGGYQKSSAPGFDRNEFSLKLVRAVQWHDWLLVNLDGQPAPFEEQVTPIVRRVMDWDFRAEGYDLTNLRHVGTIEFGEIRGNWKIVVENFIEPYHVPFVHSDSCAGQPLEAHFAISDGRLVGSAASIEGSRAAVSLEEQEAAAAREQLDSSALYLVLFPNFALGFYGDSVISILTVPLAADRTRERFDLYVWDYVEPTPETIEGWMDLNRRINAEDIGMIEAMQEGLASPVMDEGAVISPHWEHCIQQFEKMVAEGVL